MAVARSRRGAGRPRTAVLDRDRIVAASLELLDERGPEQFSLEALAERMSVRPSSFYNHTSGRDDILSGVQELVTDSIDASMFGRLPWREATAGWARSYRSAFIAHPHVVTLFALSPVRGAVRTLHMYEQVVSGFERAGWPRRTIVPALVAVESFLLGSALDAQASPGQWATGDDAAQAPRLTAAVASRDAHAERTGRSHADLAFETGLAALLDGLDTQLADHRAARRRRAARRTTPRTTTTGGPR